MKFLGLGRQSAREKSRSRRPRIEQLENRNLLSVAPTLAPISDVTLLAGAPLHIALDGFDADGDALTYLANSDNPAVATHVPTGNRSLRLSVQDFGVMEFELFEQRAPRTTGRIAELAADGFYDGVIFHRVINNFMIQGGDPTGTGSGGSGIDFDDEFHADLQHTSGGLLSMAKSDDDTNDSQFFITEGPTRYLDFNHSIFGMLTAGDDVREAISNVAVNGSDRPDTPVVIQSAEVFVDIENGVLMLSAPEGVTGSADITVTVSDGNDGTDEYTFHVTIASDPSNAQPYLGTIDQIDLIANTPMTFMLPSVDVEGDPMDHGGYAEYAEYVNLSPPQIIDNGDPGYELEGQWDWVDGEGYGQGSHFSDAGTAQDVAIWQFDVEPGVYWVAATWQQGVDRATNAPFSVFDGTDFLGTAPLNQQLPPNDYAADGTSWEYIGEVEILSTIVTVALDDNADGYVHADAVRLEQRSRLLQLDWTLDIDGDTGETTIAAGPDFVGVGEIFLGVKSEFSTWDGERDTQTVPVLVRPAAPENVRLLAAFDTGRASDDGITQFNNDGVGAEFEVTGVLPGIPVTLLIDGVAMGETIPTGTTAIVTTDGNQPLDEGAHTVTAIQGLRDQVVDVGNTYDIVDLMSDPSPEFTLTVDTIPPVVSGDPMPAATVSVPWAYDVDSDLEAAGNGYYELAEGPDDMTIDVGNGTIQWMPHLDNGTPVAIAVDVMDLAGNVTTQDYLLEVVSPLHPGDANRDGVTDLSDFNIWNANKFRTGTDWDTGDFNGDGNTDLSDFNIWNAYKFTSATPPPPMDAPSALAELLWLEQDATEEKPTNTTAPAADAVDRLLATYWT